jgi:hypothetical protein
MSVIPETQNVSMAAEEMYDRSTASRVPAPLTQISVVTETQNVSNAADQMDDRSTASQVPTHPSSTAPRLSTPPTQMSAVTESQNVSMSAEEMYDISDEIAALAFDFNLITLDTRGICRDNSQDLAACQSLFNTMTKLQKLMAEEAETVERESWNYDTSVELLNVAQNLKKIPFGGGAQHLYHLAPSLRKKGKETAHRGRCSKRSIYNLHPEISKDAWLGMYPSQSCSLFETSV